MHSKQSELLGSSLLDSLKPHSHYSMYKVKNKPHLHKKVPLQSSFTLTSHLIYQIIINIQSPDITKRRNSFQSSAIRSSQISRHPSQSHREFFENQPRFIEKKEANRRPVENDEQKGANNPGMMKLAGRNRVETGRPARATMRKRSTRDSNGTARRSGRGRGIFQQRPRHSSCLRSHQEPRINARAGGLLLAAALTSPPEPAGVVAM